VPVRGGRLLREVSLPCTTAGPSGRPSS